MFGLPNWFDPVSQLLLPEPGTAKVLVLRSDSEIAPFLVEFLTPSEQTEMQGFVHRSDQMLAQVSRGLWRLGAGVLTSTHPSEIKIKLDAYSRPSIEHSHDDQLDVNVSRTGSYCALILSRGGKCGIDIEQDSEIDIPSDVIRQVGFEDRSDHHTSTRTGEFYRRWTQIESSLKADGRGLSEGIEAVELFPSMSGKVCKSRVGSKTWYIHPIQTPDGLVGSCALGDERMRVQQISQQQIEAVWLTRSLCAYADRFNP